MDDDVMSAEEARAWRDGGVDGNRDEIARLRGTIIALHERVRHAEELADAARTELDAMRWRGALAAPEGAPCTKCEGTGTQALTGQRRRVLDAVRALGEASPSQVVAALEGVETETALNRAANVCAWLASVGLLERVGREGRRVMYRVRVTAT